MPLPITSCSPFIDPTGEYLILKITTWCMINIHLISAVLIVTIHVLLIQKIKQSTEIMKSAVNTESNTSLKVQLISITLSNILCWFCTDSVYIAAMFLKKYPINLITWTPVLFFPLHSLINPVVFIAISIKQYVNLKKW